MPSGPPHFGLWQIKWTSRCKRSTSWPSHVALTPFSRAAFFIQLRGAAVDDDVTMPVTSHHSQASHKRFNSQSHCQSGRVGIGSAPRYTQPTEHYPTDNFYLDNEDKEMRHDYPSPDSENSVQLQELRRMKTGR
ncbi:14671_t:CDS:2, partial [Acaulospora colombiana]